MKNRILILAGLLMLTALTTVAVEHTVNYTAAAKSKKFTLVIDAGHGGHDTGAVGSLTKEKTINLNVALAFGRLVERNCPDVKVIYTRKTDVFIPLHTRADIANRNKADLFISVHTNALPKGRISRGLETYTLGMHRAADNLAVAKRENEVILFEKDYKQRYQGFDPNSSESYIMFEFMQDHNMAQSVELAKFVQKRTCAQAGRQNKGVKQAGFLVLRETSMPSCLIELGFISTPDEERFLHSSSGVNSLGQGIYLAFLDYKRKHDGNQAVAQNAERQEEKKVDKRDDSMEDAMAGNKAQQDEKRTEKKKKKKKSKMAQELEDAREGKVPQRPEPVSATSQSPNADAILASISPAPVVPSTPEPQVAPVAVPAPQVRTCCHSCTASCRPGSTSCSTCNNSHRSCYFSAPICYNGFYNGFRNSSSPSSHPSPNSHPSACCYSVCCSRFQGSGIGQWLQAANKRSTAERPERGRFLSRRRIV